MGDILDAIGANVKWQAGGVCKLKGEMKGERERVERLRRVKGGSRRERGNARPEDRGGHRARRERQKSRGATAPCGRRQSEFRELALTGRYCRVHLASVQFGSWI